MAVTTTTRLGITRWSDGADPFTRAQMDNDHAQIENLVAIDQQGTFASRPAAGVRGRYYYATDNGLVYRDNGTGWTQIGPASALAGDTTSITWGVAASNGATGRMSDAGHTHGTPTAVAPTSSAPGDVVATGTGTSIALATHKHAREAWGTAGQITTLTFGGAATAGSSGAVADAAHSHGMPANPISATLTNKGSILVGTGGGAYSAVAVAADRTLLLADSSQASGVRWGQNPHLTAYTEAYEDVAASTATTTLNFSTSTIKRITLSAATTLAFTGVPASGVAFSVSLWIIQNATGGFATTWWSGIRWASGTAPALTTTANARNVVTLTTFDGGATWDGFFIGRDMR